MSYTIDRLIPDIDMATVEARTRAALSSRGFGVLTEIDVAATMKAKLGEEIAPYRILGACNPGMAFAAIGMEPRVGAMLPCNLICAKSMAGVEVSAIDPVQSMAAIDNPELKLVAGKVRDLLGDVIAAI